MYPIIPCEQALEYGATADAQRFKRQFAKASDYENLYERAINVLIWDKENQTNQVVQFMPHAYPRD
jgi:hypothetical protein